MLLKQHRFVRLAAVVLIFTVVLCVTAPAQNVSDLQLVPFPKLVQMNPEQRFSLKTPLTIHVSAKNKELLGTVLLDEMKRAGFPEPQLVTNDSDASRLVLTAEGATFADPKLPEQAGEGKSDVGESYALTISPRGIVCLGQGEAGLYYAVQTLRQLIRANTDTDGCIPCMKIEDWPSMKYRCFQDDWSRGPSPHFETILQYFDLGSQLKHNMFTYYMEDQFEFKKHPLINPKDGTLTQEEFKKAVAFAAMRHLNILGMQQSFGHLYKILAIPEYAHLAEPGFSGSPFNTGPYMLCPAIEETYSFLDDLYSEIIPLVPFGMLFVACDETWDLAKSGPSKELADEIGVGGVYLKHILRVYDLLKKYDKRMMMAGDIITNHPDKLKELPKDIVMMCWWYEPDTDFDRFIKPFSDSGFEFFVCPGQGNWSVILPLIYKYKVNIRNFVRDGCKYGTLGMINTGWEDDGESLHGYNWHAIAWGAECSWNASKTDYTDFNKRVAAVLFGVQGDDFRKAIDLLDELQIAPELGSPFNPRFWERDFLPRESPKAVERKARRILELATPAIEHLKTTKKEATINAELLDSFLFGAARMELIGTRMLAGLETAKRYTEAASLDLSHPEQKKKALAELDAVGNIVAKVRKAHRDAEKEFVRIWNSESKPFSLDRVTKKYDDLDEWFANIENRIQDVRHKVVAAEIDTTLPDMETIRPTFDFK